MVSLGSLFGVVVSCAESRIWDADDSVTRHLLIRGSLLADTRTSSESVVSSGSRARSCRAIMVSVLSRRVCKRSPVAVSHMIIFESAPPDMSIWEPLLAPYRSRFAIRVLASRPSNFAQMMDFTKSECPLYFRLRVLFSLPQLQISLSQHPANIVAPLWPPIATEVTGAAGPLYTVFVSRV